MRFEEFVNKVSNVPFIPEYVAFQVLGSGQSARNQIHRWCREGRLVRLKRGMYILSPRYKKTSPYLPYQIANQLVSPSYVSLDSALSYYGMIPERVVEITSVCMNRAKRFSNNLVVCSYRKLASEAYANGIVSAGDGEESFLIASREKALLDKIYFSHGRRYFNVSYLFESLRISESDIQKLDFGLLTEYAKAYPIKKIQLAVKKIRSHYEL